MTVAVDADQLKNRIAELEHELARLRGELERAEIQAAIRRAEKEIDEGKLIPAREAIAQLRKKHGLPTP
jgi:hypothetical protein